MRMLCQKHRVGSLLDHFIGHRGTVLLETLMGQVYLCKLLTVDTCWYGSCRDRQPWPIVRLRVTHMNQIECQNYHLLLEDLCQTQERKREETTTFSQGWHLLFLLLILYLWINIFACGWGVWYMCVVHVCGCVIAHMHACTHAGQSRTSDAFLCHSVP